MADTGGDGGIVDPRVVGSSSAHPGPTEGSEEDKESGQECMDSDRTLDESKDMNEDAKESETVCDDDTDGKPSDGEGATARGLDVDEMDGFGDDDSDIDADEAPVVERVGAVEGDVDGVDGIGEGTPCAAEVLIDQPTASSDSDGEASDADVQVDLIADSITDEDESPEASEPSQDVQKEAVQDGNTEPELGRKGGSDNLPMISNGDDKGAPSTDSELAMTASDDSESSKNNDHVTEPQNGDTDTPSDEIPVCEASSEISNRNDEDKSGVPEKRSEDEQAIIDAKIDALRQEYIDSALEDWIEDHPLENPETSSDWVREKEIALAEFEDTIRRGPGDKDSADQENKDSIAPDEQSIDVFAGFHGAVKTPSPAKQMADDGADTSAADSTAPEVPNVDLSDSKGRLGKSERYLVFKGSKISYYAKDPSQSKRRVPPRGIIELEKTTQVAGINNGTSLILHMSYRTWRFHSDDTDKIAAWTTAVVDVIRWLSTQDEENSERNRSESKPSRKQAKHAAKLFAKQEKEQQKREKEATKLEKHHTNGSMSKSSKQQTSALSASQKQAADTFKGHVHGEIRQGPGIGGFTRTELQLGDGVSGAFKNSKGTKNFISLKIDTKSMTLELDQTASCKLNAHDIGALINKAEPRYYVIVGSGSCVFIYCCPDNSERKSRMVYSTSKASAQDHVNACGVKTNAKVEITDPDDLEDDDLMPTAATLKRKRQAAVAAPPKNVKSAPKAVIADPKSMAGSLSAFMSKELGTNNKSGSGKSKKIVIAPSGAH